MIMKDMAAGEIMLQMLALILMVEWDMATPLLGFTIVGIIGVTVAITILGIEVMVMAMVTTATILGIILIMDMATVMVMVMVMVMVTMEIAIITVIMETATMAAIATGTTEVEEGIITPIQLPVIAPHEI